MRYYSAMKILEIPWPLLLSPHLRVSDTRRLHTDSLLQPASYGRIIGRFCVKEGNSLRWALSLCSLKTLSRSSASVHGWNCLAHRDSKRALPRAVGGRAR